MKTAEQILAEIRAITGADNDMKSQLLAAGWRQRSATVWRAPTGHLYRGQYGAWRAMMAGKAEAA